MTIQEFIDTATQQLTAAAIPTARLDVLILLADELQVDKSWILSHSDNQLLPAQISRLNANISRRSLHEPLAYIRGKAEFYGRDFIVSSDVLQPRPESEMIIELLKVYLREYHSTDLMPHILDVGTGCGALAITAKLEIPELTVSAIDIDAACLRIAKKNARIQHADVTFSASDLLIGADTPSSAPLVLLCNLPYVPDNYDINTAARFEPRLALFAGADGLDLYRKLFEQIANDVARPNCIITESLPFQHHGLATIARQNSYTLQNTDDLIQLFTRD